MKAGRGSISPFGEHKGQAEPLGDQQDGPRLTPAKSAGLRGDAIEPDPDCGNNRHLIADFMNLYNYAYERADRAPRPTNVKCYTAVKL